MPVVPRRVGVLKRNPLIPETTEHEDSQAYPHIHAQTRFFGNNLPSISLVCSLSGGAISSASSQYTSKGEAMPVMIRVSVLTSQSLRQRNADDPAYPLRSLAFQFAVAGNRHLPECARVDPDIMPAAVVV